ncbi:alpha/beta fold hydrolase [bacterium]|nr:alpha/beta fold hydrolase [bacterium]
MFKAYLPRELYRWNVSIFLSVFLITNLFSRNLQASGKCEKHVYSFQDLARTSQQRIQRLGENSDQSIEATPALLLSALPEGARYIEKPLSKAPNHRYYRQLGVGKGYVGIDVEVDFKGRKLRTNVGVSPQALVDNVWRHTRKEKKSLVSDSARAVVVWLHGGGTNLSSWQNGANVANSLASKNIEVVSLDFFGHGNGPRDFYQNPEDYIRFVLEFMNQYVADSKVPVILAGHSMGGMISDITSLLYPKARLEKEYPNLNLQAMAMLSPPADPTPGKAFHERFDHDNEAREEDETEKLLTEANNINLPSQMYLLALDFLHRWDSSLLSSEKERLPMFFAMGTGDELWQGKEELFEAFVAARPNIKREYYRLYSTGVDFNNKELTPGHIIPAVFSSERPRLINEGKEALRDPRVNHPEVFVDLMNFIENEVIKETFTPELDPNQNINNTLSRIIDLWGSSSFFRSFVEVYAKSSKKTSNPGLVRHLSRRSERIANFGKIYFSTLTTDSKENKKERSEVEGFRQLKDQLKTWTSGQIAATQELQKWYQTLPEDVRASFIFDFFNNLLEFNSPLSDDAPVNRNDFFGVVEVPNDLPGSNVKIVEALLNESGPQLLNSLRASSDLANEMISGDYTNSVDENDSRMAERNKAREALDDLSQKRNNVLLELATLNSRRIQLDRVFVEFTLAELWNAQDELENNTELKAKLFESHETIDSIDKRLSETDAATNSKALSDDLLPIIDLLVAEYKEYAFHSLMGYKARYNLSELHSRLPKLKTMILEGKRPEQIVRELKKISSAALEFCSEAKRFYADLESNKKRSRDRLDEAEETVSSKRSAVFDASQEFFDYRGKLVSDWISSGVFGTEQQPQYPPRYNQLIENYQRAQIDFQMAKQNRDKIFHEEAALGNFGSLVGFIAKDLQQINKRIKQLERKELHDLEIDIQRIAHSVTDLQNSLDQEYSKGLFFFREVNILEFLSQEPVMPLDISPLQDLLFGWRNIWREVPEEAQNLDAY